MVTSRRAVVVLGCLLSLPAAADPAAFQPGDSYFAGTGAAGAAEHFAAGRWQEARDGFAAYLTSKQAPRGEAARGRVTYLVARCDAKLDRWAEAAAGFDAAAKALPALAGWVSYDAAFAYYHAHDMTAARARAEAVGKDEVAYPEARLLLGDVLRAGGKWDEAETLYRDYLATWPDGIRVAEARFHLATALEKLDKAAPEVLALYRQITIEAPLEAWNERAQARLDELLPELSKKKRKRLVTLTAAEHVTRGMVYFEAMRNEESEKEFRAALKADGLDRALRCKIRYHLAQSVFKQRERARSAPLFDDAIKACKKAKDTDLLARAAYQGGRAWSAKGEHDKALERLARVEKDTPDHSFADDARLRAAEQWAFLEEQSGEKGDKDAAAEIEKLLGSLPEKYPQGDMRAEALWRLAWRAWKAGDFAKAIEWLDAEIAAVPHDDNYFAEGQAHYWKGRAYAELGKPAEARASFERAVREYPLSYYALLALNRLRETDEKAYAALVAELATPPAVAPAAGFAPRAVYGEPGFARAVELVRMGLGAEAERELGKLGLKVPPGKAKVTDPDQAEQLAATAVLYDRAGRHDQSHWIHRWAVLDYKLAWPTKTTRATWDVAYPKAFWHILQPAAKDQGYPPELLIAFVREESAFTPTMESFANAIGLTQMIFPTAERFGKDLGFDITRENLQDPVKNVAVGSRFLAFLWKTFDQNLGLLIPAYNAGEGAVWKWLCVRGDRPLDEFAEDIPYDETRNYSKRVLNSYFIYQYLSDGSIPVVPNAIPAHVINQKKCKGAKPARENADKPDRKKKKS